MALYYSLGTNLIPAAEILEKSNDLQRLAEKRIASVELQSASFRRSDVFDRPLNLASEDAGRPFTPIGPGKPLTIYITSIYPGDLPPRDGLFGLNRGALVTSAVKSWQSFDAQPRALNILKDKAQKRTPISGPAAVEEGSPLVFYSPAVIDRSLILTFEMAFDNVDEEFFQQVGDVFAGAAGLPVFASASPFLLAASSLIKVGSRLANSLFDSRAEFQATENIALDVAGKPAALAGHALVTRSELDERALQSHFVQSSGELVDKTTDAPYQGEIPYVVMALDGRADPALDGFRATAASASILQRFYNVRSDGETDADVLIEALKFYNDFRYRTEAQKLHRLSQQPGLSADDKEALEKRIEALLKNIQSELFQLSAE